MTYRSEVVRRVWEQLEPELAEQGYELVDVEFEQGGGYRVLRLFLDREGGVTLDHCAQVSQLLSPLLDVKGFMEGRYALEVSSPGVDRRIRKPEDFVRFADERIRMRTYEPVRGRKRFRGTLKGLRDDLVQVECEGSIYEVHLENLKRANLDR